ncbi:MAG: NAD(P)/FAD-dependent oxidoreductase [Promethearchaeota archaeon]
MIKISGAGISGLSAAITLGHNKRRVIIRDIASSIKEKTSRGINAIRNYKSDEDILKEYQKLGLNLKDFHPINRQIILVDAEKYIEVESEDKSMFYTIPRGREGSIDNMLFHQATSLNVKVEWNTTFKNPDILATGSKYSHCVGYGKHFIDVDDTSTIYILQNSKYAPYGYMCILPYSKNEATLILGTFKPGYNVDMKKKYEQVLKEIPQFRDYVQGATVKHKVEGFGNFGMPDTATDKDRIVIGESAGLLEAYRGFGIHSAIMSGYAAGLALTFGTDYDELWRDMIGITLQRDLMRRLAENELNVNSEMILLNLIDKLPKQVTVDTLQYEKNKFERKLLNRLGLSDLNKYITDWNQKYQYVTSEPKTEMISSGTQFISQIKEQKRESDIA